ncbi:hypothetical protein Hlac_2907 [Halorubrum lacusprofundi ATCC 49239]|jgi:ORC complex protein Cdc6/Orc1|uniref:Uncharacterized protein n=1 Tax=Halorubrum lacusprofundi (strain ATCC 49239 / DSM 5036 / JCM 8891 / ACAM 34) TaxID=416348 RepID=B9LW75_HALLT|nr:hypothetical protein Hlac_2907 [Halorubrum lacusprofundi ATCC 49239]
MLVKMLGPKSSRRAWIHSPNTSGSSTILFVTTAPSDQAKFTTAILRRSTTHRRSGLFTYLSKMPQYNLLEAEGTSRDREYSLIDSAATSPM